MLDNEFHQRLIAFRRHLHAHPELSRQEFETTAAVADALRGAGLAPRVLDGGTGLLCDIGTGPGPTVALRADLDALPLPDEKTVDYRSTRPGVCHACGHDVHTTVLLGVGLTLAERAGSLPGRVRLVFQPAEEAVPSGSLDVIGQGALDDVDAILALHCDPSGEAGQVGLRIGPITSSLVALTISLERQGGRGVDEGADLVQLLAKIVTDVPQGLQHSLGTSPATGASVVFGAMRAEAGDGGTSARAHARGTLRALNRVAWNEAQAHIERIIDSVATPHGVRWSLGYDRVAPAVINDERVTRIVSETAIDLLGEARLYEAPQSLGGEDFAWYLENGVPGTLVRLGVRPPGTDSAPDLHAGNFDVDEDAIAVGVRVMTASALRALEEYADEPVTV